ncbi:MAG TPA: hypothetical protein VJX67_00515 [Blastocatellia bacterium]|nr:hypothetical protein [Blastocatellia bacterium]
MKKLTLITMAFIAAVAFAAASVTTTKAASPKIEKAVVEFPTTVKLQGVFLKGTYLLVHDQEKMLAGEPCTYVYEYRNERKGKLVTSFHCIPVDRPLADGFTVRLTRVSPNPFDIQQVTEFQFEGSTEAHQVPAL